MLLALSEEKTLVIGGFFSQWVMDVENIPMS